MANTPEQSNTSQRAGSHALLVFLLVIVTVSLFAPLPKFVYRSGSYLLLDFAHFPVGAALTWMFWAMLGRRIVPALFMAVALSGLCEVLQHLTGRVVSPIDFLRGLLGILAMGIVLARPWRRPVRTVRAMASVCGIVLLSVWPIIEVMPLFQGRNQTQESSVSAARIVGDSSPAASIRSFSR